MIEITDEFLSEEDYEKMMIRFTDINFPWYLGKKSHQFGDLQLCHMLYNCSSSIHQSPYLEYISPILRELKLVSISRIKVNCQLLRENPVKSDYHNDLVIQGNIEPNVTNLLYYLNSNNGYTEFENGDIVESVGNRLVKFPNTLKHRGVSQTNSESRIVLNFNLCFSSSVG